MKAAYRQGDVFLIPIKAEDWKKLKKKEGAKIVAFGEATGHHHVLTDDKSTLFVNEDGDLILRAEDGTKLEHLGSNGVTADHEPITIDPGVYKVVIQKEYAPGKKYKRVID